MSILRFVAGIYTLGWMTLNAATVYGQSYPNKPIRVVTTPAGSGTDFVSRLLARGISGSLGQQVVVENRPAAVIGSSVAQAPPDGYTLVLNGSSFWLTSLLVAKPTYDVPRDFAPISLLTSSPNILAVHPSLPVKSVKELIALAKARPGALNYGSSTLGSPTHLAAELFKSMASVDIVRITYNGGGPAVSALLGGHVQLMFSSAPSVEPHIKSGRLRALAVTSLQPSALAPGLPTVAAALPGYAAASTYALLAPVGTPAVIINRLNQEVVRYLNTPSAKEQLLSAGVELVGSSPEQLGATIKSDLLVWGKVIKDAGIQAD